MTAISDIYDAIKTKVSGALTGYSELPNPYDLEDNTELYLDKGYAVAVGPGVNSERFESCRRSFVREFEVGLVNLVSTTVHNTAAKDAIIKQALEDHDAVWEAFETDSDLGGNAAKSIVLQDNGFTYLEAGRDKYLLLVMTVTVEYFRNFT